jgi:hypothetical protein
MEAAMNRAAAYLLLTLFSLTPLPMMAKSATTNTVGRAKLSASTRLALRLWQQQRPLPVPGREAMVDANEARLTLRFTTVPTEERLRELESLGVTFWHHNGRIARRGALVPARVPFALLETVEFWPDVERAELRLQPPRPELLENAPQMVETPPVWAEFDGAGIPLRGKGVKVGVLDSWLEPYHPWFFRPDGIHVAWFDSNENGVFEPGIDGIDENQDGLLGAGEITHLLKGTVEWDEGSGVQFENTAPSYYPPLDWLWQDTNGSSKREFGPGQGFNSMTPALGEPIFVADDVNQNDVLDVGEKLVGLRTSKIHSIHFVAPEKTFERGVNLIDYPVPLSDYSHATMTIGVLAGGAHPYQPYSGVAPDADIMLADMNQGSTGNYLGSYGEAYLAASILLADAGADVLMHEYGWPIMEFGDGSSLLETGIDAIAESDGVLSCTAAHNYAGYNMHAVAAVPAGGSITFPINANIYGDDYPTGMLYFTLRHVAPTNSITLTLQGGDNWQQEFGAEGGEWDASGFDAWYSGLEVSPRGTHMMSLALYPDSYGAEGLPGDQWSMVVHNSGSEEVTVDLFAADQTGYLYTATIAEYATKAGTMSHPATADSAVTVGAYRANVDSWYAEVEIGDLSFYSGQGPRIDGERGLDIVGPSDMIAAWWSETMSHHPGFRYASGTSGSLPQVTGVVALLLQNEPGLSPAEVKQRIIDGAIRDQFTGPEMNPTWGAGKLSAYRTLFGEEPPDNEPPTAFVTGPGEVMLQESFILDASGSTDDGPVDELEIRWDLNYDGSFDIPYRAEMTLPVEAIYEPGLFVALAEVRDGAGYSDRALVRIVVLDELYHPPLPEEIAEPTPEDDVEIRSDDPSTNPDGDRVVQVRPGGCNASGQQATPWPWLALVAFLLITLTRGRKDCNQPP